MDREEGGTLDGKRSGGQKKGNKSRNELSTYLDDMSQSFFLNLAWLPMISIA